MSLEEKVKALEAENGQLRALIARLEERIRQLEAQVAKSNKNSGNSSQPPSSDITKPPQTGGSSSPRKIGGQPGHPRHERTAFSPEQVEARQIHGLERCPDCGSRELEALPESTQVVQQVELLPKPFQVTEHVIEACRCRNCQKIQTGELPAAIARTGLIGPRMRGLLLFMKGALRASYGGL